MTRNYLFSKRAVGIVTMALIFIMPTIVSRANESQWNWDGQWKLGGHNLNNTRNQATERYLKPENVASLSPKWVFTTGGDISATPAVLDGSVYLPDWGGNLFKINAQTGEQIWSNTIANYISDPSIPKAVSRTSPAVEGNKVIIGSLKGAFLMAINKNTGQLIWKTKLDSHPNAIITQSPTIYSNRVYVGVSSGEPIESVNPNYPCCTFRGSMTSVDLTTGKILWKTYTVPDNGGQPGGYSGAPVWGSTPAIDPKRKLVYIATGNNYDVPQRVKDCIVNSSKETQSQCLDPDNHVDAIMALDLDTGAIKWSNKLWGYDAFTSACFPGNNPANCPDPRGDDYDFGQAPMLFTVKNAGKSRDLVGAAQKSGIFWALNPDTGKVVWSQIVGPGGAFGAQWGSATDGKHVYVGNLNINSEEYTLQPSGETITGGSWSALDAATGKIIWQTADPAGGNVGAPMTVANGVVYAGSMASGSDKNNMYALSAKTGEILWGFNTAGSVIAGAAVVNGTVYWGSGYSNYNQGVANNKLYAFTVFK
ncbi:PQQ-binding-like beta-propeller repeat protein [Nostoc commune]|uniref:outer membrane protein assembly factor BamB family protein n=1 Tax=Nostoc commune TaxID=1178 RepID=UPI0018C5A45C|nr:PQQ-binding-like beta-propeller repeat protein [Nostoc commune]MBG1264596.1 PQQ-binding-like beta-propeller repeat protein [Nostoc commune BAE]